MDVKHYLICSCLLLLSQHAQSQDWKGIPIPANPGEGMMWEFREEVSYDFNYESAPSHAVETIAGKWTNFYHNAWTGPAPTYWQRDHVWVSDGKMQLKTTRMPGDSVNIPHNGQSIRRARTNLGCATSTRQVIYPVYIEANVKIMNSVLASDVWLLSADDTQEIDICEAYGSSRWTNAWFSDKRIHLSHHVFIRNPFQDWQTSDEGSFYNDGSTIWNQNYHRIGVYWRDPWHLEYYVDGQLVRTRSGKDQIDPVYFTNATDPGNAAMDTRTGLSKPMDIIINAEDQTWRAAQGLTPTDAELANEQNNTFKVDWIRVYKPTAAPKPSGGFGVFPNPANTRLQVKGEALNEDFQLEIINQVGAVVAVNHYQDQSQTIEFDISQLVPGYYSLRLITGSEIYQSRFVKE